MKRLVIAALAVSGCFHYTWVTPGETIPPTMTVSGADSNINWICELKSINEKLVWFECDFHNYSNTPARVCVQIDMLKSSTVIAESRWACSGLLNPYNNISNYIAFSGQQRDTLNVCGPLLGGCSLLINSKEK
jgi:hypothetical protein